MAVVVSEEEGLVWRLKMLVCMRAAARVLDVLPKPSKGGWTIESHVV
jgi:hypothetical protein